MYKKGIWTWEAAHSGVGKVILSMDFKELITTPNVGVNTGVGCAL